MDSQGTVTLTYLSSVSDIKKGLKNILQEVVKERNLYHPFGMHLCFRPSLLSSKEPWQ